MTKEITTPNETAPAQTVEMSPQEMMGAVLMAVKDPDVDADKADKLLAMIERQEDREAKKAFTRALVEFKKDPPRIVKNMAVSFKHTSYKHATIDSVCRQVDPVLFNLGLAFRWRVEADIKNNVIRVFCILSHVDGYSEESFMESRPDDSGGKNAIQGSGSAVQYMKRYTLLASLGLAEQGEDDDGLQAAMKKTVDEQQVEHVQELCEKAGVSAQQVCSKFKVDSLNALTQDQYGAAVGMLNARAAK